MKKCKQGYYYCYTDEVCKPIPKGLRVTARFSGGGKEPEETGIDVPTNGNGDGNGNGGGDGGGGMGESTILEKLDGKSAKDKGYSLRDWFKGGGWKQAGGKYDGKPCAKQPGQTTKPYCRDPDDRAAMSKDERDKRSAKKRKEDPNPDRKGKAKIVTQKNSFEPEGNLVDEGKKDACYKKVKASAKVWPSAYASGRLVQCRKKGAANYGNKSESIEYSDWRDDFKATEYEFFDIIKAEPLVSEGAMPDAIDPKAHRTAQRTKKIRDRTKTGDEGSTIAKKKLRGPSLPMEEVETVVEGQKCWKGYVKKGTKKMFGKVVNNCVKKEEFVDEAKHTATKSDLESKIGGGNLKKLVVKAVKRIDYDVDGDVDPNDKVEKKTGDYGEELPTPFGKFKTKIKKEEFSDWRNELGEAIDKSKMKCNSPKAQAVGDSQTGKSHVVKACEGGTEKIIRFGQRGVKGSPKKEGESKGYASRRNRFKTRHAKNISKGKMSAAYWSNKVKW